MKLSGPDKIALTASAFGALTGMLALIITYITLHYQFIDTSYDTSLFVRESIILPTDSTYAPFSSDPDCQDTLHLGLSFVNQGNRGLAIYRINFSAGEQLIITDGLRLDAATRPEVNITVDNFYDQMGLEKSSSDDLRLMSTFLIPPGEIVEKDLLFPICIDNSTTLEEILSQPQVGVDFMPSVVISTPVLEIGLIGAGEDFRTLTFPIMDVYHSLIVETSQHQLDTLRVSIQTTYSNTINIE